MERNAVAAGSMYRMKPQGTRLPSIMKLSLGVDFITSPYNVNIVEFSDLVEYAKAVIEVAGHVSDIEPEFCEDGWEFLSDLPEVIEQTCLEYDGQVVSEDETLKLIFHQTVLDEVNKNRKRYGMVNVDQLAEFFADQYVVSEKGYFRRIENDVNVVTPRASVYGIDYSDAKPEVEEEVDTDE
jgi:hypothetical protein